MISPPRSAGSAAPYDVPAAQGPTELVLGVIPTTLFSPLVGSSVLPTLFVALLSTGSRPRPGR